MKICFFRLEIKIYILRRWDLKLTPGLTQGSQGGWGWPQLQRGTAAKSGKRDLPVLPKFPLLCTRNFPPCLPRLPVIFSACKIHRFFFCNACITLLQILTFGVQHFEQTMCQGDLQLTKYTFIIGRKLGWCRPTKANDHSCLFRQRPCVHV